MTPQEAIERLKGWRRCFLRNAYRGTVKMSERDKINRSKNADTYNMAIFALEKQMPKKTVPTSDNIFEFGNCPNCGAEFNSELICEYEIQYCPYCGQALDWSQENEPIDEQMINVSNLGRWD